MGKRVLLVVVYLLAQTLYSLGQELKKDSVLLRSPQACVQNHLKYLQQQNYKPELAAKSLYRGELTEVELIKLSVQLKQIFDAKGIYIDLKAIPNNPNYFDSLRDEYSYVIHPDLPDIFVKKYGALWKYSEESVQEINSIHGGIFLFGIDELVNLFPKSGHKKIFGVQIWQYVGIFILIILGVIIEKIFEFFLLRGVGKFLARKGKKKLANKVILPVTKPFSLVIVLLLTIILIPVLKLPIHINHYIILGIKALIPLLLTIVFYKIADLLSDYLQGLAEKTESTLDDQLIPLLRKILKIFVVVIGGLFILLNLNINIIPLLTGLSIGSLALALAAQDTLKNFFGSIMIFLDRPFQIGQWITSGDVDGTIEEVGFRSTRIRTFRNSLVYVPNGKLADSTIDNHGLRNFRRFYTKIGVMYDTPPELMEVFVEGLKDLALKHPKTVKDRMEIHFNDMGDFSLQIMFYIFFDVSTWSEELKARNEVLLGIMRLADKLGVNFAFPTTTMHMETFPEKKALSPQYAFSPDELKKMKNEFIDQYEIEKK